MTIRQQVGRRTGWVAAALLAVAVVCTISVTTAPPAAAATGTASGSVSSPEGGLLSGIAVVAYDAVWGAPIASTSTDGAGAWSLALSPGPYRIHYSDPAGMRADRFSGNAPTWVASTAVMVPDGGAVVDDAVMPERDTVVGTVTDPDGNPVAGIDVGLLWNGWAIQSDTTAADGTYGFAGLNAATYSLVFEDGTGTWATEYAGGSNTVAGASMIDATGGTVHTVDHTVHHGGALTGKTGIGDTGPAPGTVYIVVLDADILEPLAVVTSSSDGTWTAPNLAPGEYKVATIDPAYFSASPDVGYRPVLHPERDIVSEGLGPAYTNATRFSIASDALTSTGRQPLRGWHCDPTARVPGVDLSGANLTGENLRGCNLPGAVFAKRASGSAANLTQTDLRWANLTAARFWEADYGGYSTCCITAATTTGMRITGADLSSARIAGGHQLLTANRDWTGTIFTGAIEPLHHQHDCGWGPWEHRSLFSMGVMHVLNAYSYCHMGTLPEVPTYLALGAFHTFPDLILTGTRMPDGSRLGDLPGKNLEGLVCRACTTNVTGDDWWGVVTHPGTYPADLTGADLDGADLTGTDMALADLTGASLTNAILAGTTLTDADLTDANLTGVDLTNANLTGVDLTSANLTGVDLTSANLTGIDLTNANLTSATLTGATLTDATLTGANLTDANLASVNATRAEFTSSELTRTRITNARLTRASGLTKTQLISANHNWNNLKLNGTGVDLSGVNFTGYRLTGANLTGVGLSGSDLTGVWSSSLAGTILASADLTLANLLGVTGNPSGGSTATYGTTTCPDGTVASPSTPQDSCVGHGLTS